MRSRPPDNRPFGDKPAQAEVPWLGALQQPSTGAHRKWPSACVRPSAPAQRWRSHPSGAPRQSPCANAYAELRRGLVTRQGPDLNRSNHALAKIHSTRFCPPMLASVPVSMLNPDRPDFWDPQSNRPEAIPLQRQNLRSNSKGTEALAVAQKNVPLRSAVYRKGDMHRISYLWYIAGWVGASGAQMR